MLKFYKQSTNISNFYYFADDNGKFYYWKTTNNKAHKDCFDEYGRLIGINALEYEIKKGGKRIFYIDKWFEEIKVTNWERCH